VESKRHERAWPKGMNRAPRQSLRVVYIVSRFPMFSETFIVREICELLRLRVDVRIISLKHGREPVVQSASAALVDRVIYPASFWQNARQMLTSCILAPTSTIVVLARIVRCFLWRPEEFCKSVIVWWRTLGVIPVVQALEPDHLHAHYATYPSTAALILAERLHVPFSFTSHAHDVFGEPHLLDHKLRKAAFSSTISQCNKRHLAKRTGGQGLDRMQVIHCGVSLAEYAFQPEGRRPWSIAAVGRLEAIKGFRFLIDACAILTARGHRYTCNIIGDGPLRSTLEEQIDRLGLGTHVRLRGAMKQEQVRVHLYEASVFVLPSVRTTSGDIMDGIPVALMEAMAAGTPVVSTTVSGIPELIDNAVSGLLAVPEDPNTLADCIERILADSRLAHALTINARVRIENEFDVRNEARKLYELFADSFPAPSRQYVW
jgi:colanic acid/amylovoran biosynthesis glycosyltransferase